MIASDYIPGLSGESDAIILEQLPSGDSTSTHISQNCCANGAGHSQSLLHTQRVVLGVPEPVCSPGGEHCPHGAMLRSRHSVSPILNVTVSSTTVGGLHDTGHQLERLPLTGLSSRLPRTATPSLGCQNGASSSRAACVRARSTAGEPFTNCLTRLAIPACFTLHLGRLSNYPCLSLTQEVLFNWPSGRASVFPTAALHPHPAESVEPG